MVLSPTALVAKGNTLTLEYGLDKDFFLGCVESVHENLGGFRDFSADRVPKYDFDGFLLLGLRLLAGGKHLHQLVALGDRGVVGGGRAGHGRLAGEVGKVGADAGGSARRLGLGRGRQLQPACQ